MPLCRLVSLCMRKPQKSMLHYIPPCPSIHPDRRSAGSFIFSPVSSSPWPSSPRSENGECSTSGVYGAKKNNWKIKIFSFRRKMNRCASARTAFATTICISKRSRARSWAWSGRAKWSTASPRRTRRETRTAPSANLLPNFPGHRDKNHLRAPLDALLPGDLFYPHQLLAPPLSSHRHHQAPFFAELAPQRFGNAFR